MEKYFSMFIFFYTVIIHWYFSQRLKRSTECLSCNYFNKSEAAYEFLCVLPTPPFSKHVLRIILKILCKYMSEMSEFSLVWMFLQDAAITDRIVGFFEWLPYFLRIILILTDKTAVCTF